MKRRDFLKVSTLGAADLSGLNVQTRTSWK